MNRCLQGAEMERNDNRRHGKGRGWNNKNHGGKQQEQRKSDQRRDHSESHSLEARSQFHPHIEAVTQESIAENENAIRAFKANAQVCELCGQPITDISSAVANRGSGNPVHFDCVLNKLNQEEHPAENDKVTYIGAGKFAVLHFDNPHDMRHFSIVKTIEWEDANKKADWRSEIAGLYSQVK
jgi:hypothetical protein